MIPKLNGHIGQIESSIDTVEEHLNDEEFHDFCDAVGTLTAYLKLIKKRYKAKDA